MNESQSTRLAQLQFIRSNQRIYAMNRFGQVLKDYECRSDFVPG